MAAGEGAADADWSACSRARSLAMIESQSASPEAEGAVLSGVTVGWD